MVINLAALFDVESPEAMAGAGHIADHFKRVESLLETLIKALSVRAG